MPCTVCGSLLGVREMESDLQTHLYCPRCEGQDVEAKAVIDAKTEFLREDSKLQQKNIPEPLKKYRKHELLYYLITRINKHAHRFFERNGILLSEFGYLPELIREVFREDGFGDQRLNTAREVDEDITILRDGYSVLHRSFHDASDGFVICVKDGEPSVNFEKFTQDYDLIPTEKDLAFNRIVTSLVCGGAENWQTYNIVTDTLRNFIDHDELSYPETVEEFAHYWYEFIMQLKVTASLDEFVNDVYYSQLSNEITILQIESFLKELDESLAQIKWEKTNKGLPVSVDRALVDAAGEKAFGECWETVKDQLIVRKDNPDGHSFLFEIEQTKVFPKADGSGTATISERTLVYPKHYARLLKFQIFPLLRNEGTADTGHKLLKRLTEERSETYEENFYNFVKDNSVECYLRPEISASDGSELDILRVLDNEIHFIELKLLVPPPNLRREEGMTVLNEKFDLTIFNEESERVNRTATGKTFPEKMDMWLGLAAGDSFNADRSASSPARESKTIGGDWWEKDVRRFVVSNLSPTYIEKDGIRFLTDFEYVVLLEGDETVLYPIWDGRREQNR